MKILTVVKDLGIGGTQRSAQNYSVGYQEAGYEAAILNFQLGGVREVNIRNNNIMIFNLNSDDNSSKVIQDIKSWSPNIIHVHRTGIQSRVSGQVIRKIKSFTCCPIVETNHFGKPDYSLDNNLIDIHFQLAKWSLWKWNNWIRADKTSNISVEIPHIVVNTKFSPSPSVREVVRSKLQVPSDAIVFGRIGQPILAKWSPIIFKAFEKIYCRYKKVYLLLIGLPDFLKISLDQLPSDVRNHIIVKPIVHSDEELNQYYNAMDIFLHASAIGESFGYVLAEAMLCEVPVITLSTPTKDNSQLEVVGHLRGGLVVTDLNAMVKAMEIMINDCNLRSKLGSQGRNWVMQEYSSQKVIGKIDRIFDILNSNRNHLEIKKVISLQKELITKVDDSVIIGLLKHTLGNTSLIQYITMRSILNPLIYKIYSNWKFSEKDIF